MQQATLAFADERTEPEQNLRKATGAIHIRNDNITPLQRKLMNGLLYCAAPQLADFRVVSHQVPVAVLAGIVGFNSNNSAYLKRAVTDLVGIRIGWNILHPDGSAEWGVAALLADAVIHHGVMTYSFAPQLRERLASPDRWAPIDMSIVRKFDTGPGIALYENCEPYRGVGQTPFFKLSLFRELLGASGSSYDEFKALNRSVIKPAINEVNKHARFHVEAELKRERRQVVAVKLLITQLSQSASTVETAESEMVDKLLATALDERLLEQLTLDYCLGQDTACKVLRDHPADRLMRVMEYVGKRYMDGKVGQDRIAPYFLATLAKWEDGPTTSRLAAKRGSATPGRKDAVDSKQRAAEDRAKALRETRKQEAEKRLALLTVEERVALESDFEAYVAKHHTPVLKILQDHGVTHPMIKGAFNEYLQDHLLGEATTA